jgi:hypothetical protein
VVRNFNAIDRAAQLENLQRTQAEPITEIKSTCKPNVRPAQPAVRIKATGEVIPVAPDNAASARMMVASGLAVETTVEAEGRKPGIARVFVYTNDHHQNAIRFECKTCGQGAAHFPQPTEADIATIVFWHCGQDQRVPASVAQEYIAAGGSREPDYTIEPPKVKEL